MADVGLETSSREYSFSLLGLNHFATNKGMCWGQGGGRERSYEQTLEKNLIKFSSHYDYI